MARGAFPRGGVRARLPVMLRRLAVDEFDPTDISGLALWLDAADTSSTYTTDAGPVTAVSSPLDIAGCQLWLDASDAAYVTSSGGVVSQWTDKSPTGSAWTVTSGDGGPSTGAATINGRNVLVFDGTNDSLSASAPLNTSMPLTMFIVQRISTATLAGMTYAAGTGDAFNMRQAGTTSGFLEVIAGGSRVFLGGSARTGINDIVAVTFPAAADASLYVQGLVQSPLTNAALKPTLTGTHYIGKRADGFYLNGQIAEIVAYSAALTTAQRASVEAYLATKWAISGVHRSAAQEIAAVNSPTELSGCVGWWDASDAASITQSGGLVSQINDKSGLAAHASQGTSGSQPTLVASALNGRSVLRFDGGDALLGNFASTISTNTYSVFAVCKVTVGGNNFRVFSVAGAASSDFASGSVIPCLQSAGNVGQLSAYDGIAGNVGTVSGFAGYALFSGVRGSTTVTNAADGIKVAPASTTLTTPVTRFGIGAPAQGISGGALWNGDIAEVIYYSVALSDTDRARVEKYLQQKWATTTVPDPTPPVGYWADKSGNNRHAVQATAGKRGAVGTQNGRRAITLDGTDDHFVLGDLSAAFPTAAEIIASYGITSTDTGYVIYQTANNITSDLFGATSFSGAFKTTRLNGASLALPTTAGAYLWGVASSSSSHELFAQGAKVLSSAADYSAGTNHAIGTRTADGTATTSLAGRMNEVCVFNRVLTISERQRVNRYLAAKWGITLAPQVSNADAQDWVNRVYANGGTVSSATASAVNTLCDSLDAASLRDRFYRLNLFCGTGLNAALVPLYQGPSLGGTQYGGTTDTNVGPFVSGDFAETGASGGLKGNGSSKYLDTGVLLDTLHAIFPSLHMSAYVTATAGTPQYLGGLFSSGTSGFVLGIGANQLGGTTSISDTANISTAGMHTVSRTLSDSIVLYKNTTQVGSSSTSTTSATNASQKVFAMARSGATNSPVGYSDQYFRAYSLGGGMTAPQLNAYYTAMQAFQAAMTRNV